MDTKELVEAELLDYYDKLMGGHSEVTDEVKELTSQTADEILGIFS